MGFVIYLSFMVLFYLFFLLDSLTLSYIFSDSSLMKGQKLNMMNLTNLKSGILLEFLKVNIN